MMCRDWTRVRPFFAQEVGEQLSEGWGDTKSAYRVMQVYKYTICKKRKPVTSIVHHIRFLFVSLLLERREISVPACFVPCPSSSFLPSLNRPSPPPPPPPPHPSAPFFTYFLLFVFSHNYCVLSFLPLFHSFILPKLRSDYLPSHRDVKATNNLFRPLEMKTDWQHCK